MGHDHAHDHSSSNIRAAFFLNLGFAVFEIIGGLYTNSVAILSDAVHDLGDSLSLGVAWYFQRIAKKGEDKDFSYGYKRFSILGAVINAIVLTIGSVFIITESIPRLFDPVMPDATGMIFLSVVGIAINGYAAFKLSHGNSMNERVVYLHLLEDVLGWTATLVVSVTLQFQAWPVLDPLLSLLISVYILYNVFKNMKKSVLIILQGTPEGINTEQIHEAIRKVDDVRSIHDCHIWTMDGSYHVLSSHIVVDHGKTLEEIAELKGRIKEQLKDFKINHITLEFESEEEACVVC